MAEVICPLCRGRGLFTDSATGATELCERCGGTGTVPFTPSELERLPRDSATFPAHPSSDRDL